MKSINMAKTLLVVTLLALSVSAFASNKATFSVSSAFTVNGKQFSAGEYSIKWEGAGTDVQVSILKGSHVIGTVPAHLIDLNASAANDSTVVTKKDDGTVALSQIRFGGKKKAISFDAVTTQTSSLQP